MNKCKECGRPAERDFCCHLCEIAYHTREYEKEKRAKSKVAAKAKS